MSVMSANPPSNGKPPTNSNTNGPTVRVTQGITVYITTDTTLPVSTYDSILIEETKNCFKSKGFSITDNTNEADLIVATSINTSKVGGNFNPIGCLVCGIFGVIQNEATINLKAIIYQNKAQIWNNTASASASGEFLFGLFEDTAPLVKRTIITGVTELFKTYNAPK